MSFLKSLFDQLIGKTVERTVKTGQAQLRAATVGKVEGKIHSARAGMEQKLLRAQQNAIKKATTIPSKGDLKMPQAKMPQAKMPQGKMPQGGPMPQGGGPMGQGGPMAQGQWQPGYGGGPGGSMGPGVPNYGGAPGGGGVEKTQAIDLSQFQAESRQVVGWLVAQNGPHKGSDFRLYNGKNVLGTAADCDIVITDPYLSTKHCTIRYENGNFMIIDLDSRNGTVVNQKRISKEDLIDNDTVRLGKTEFKFKALF